MAELDRRTIEELGVNGLVLMEAAAGACVDVIMERYRERLGSGVVVLCGPGNNGGDGLAIGRLLQGLRVSVELLVLQPPGGLGGDAASQLHSAISLGMEPRLLDVGAAQMPAAIAEHWSSRGLIVDALFGTGLSRAVEGIGADLVAAMGQARSVGVPILSVDIPSGVHGGSGQPLGAAVAADLCVSFAAAKTGHFQEPGRSLRGELVVSDIGIPTDRWPDIVSQATRLLSEETLRLALAEQRPAAHKGSFGHVLVVAGGPGKCGAARLCAEAALRAGAGLVTLAIAEGLPLDSLHELRPEVMVARVPGAADGSFSLDSGPPLLELLESRDALAVGPGIGTSEATRSLVVELFVAASPPAVFDADALNCLAGSDLRQLRASSPRILTPHPGEVRRLLGRSETEPVTDRLGAARELARRYAAIAVLKGAGTVVAEPKGRCSVNPTGNAGMATAGTGDVLTGVIAALLGRGLDAVLAASAGVYWHGLAGDIAARGTGQPSLLAGDVIASLGMAWQEARQVP
jgi:NAD(P)H-hydrate epimerase